MGYFVQFVAGVLAAWWGSSSPAVSDAGTGEYDEGTEEGFLCVCVCVDMCVYACILNIMLNLSGKYEHYRLSKCKHNYNMSTLLYTAFHAKMDGIYTIHE